MTGYKRLVEIFILKQIKDADCGRQIHKGSWTVHLFACIPKAGILHTQHLTGETRLLSVMDDFQSAEDPGNVKYSH